MLKLRHSLIPKQLRYSRYTRLGSTSGELLDGEKEQSSKSKGNPSSMDAGEPNESRQRHKGGCALGDPPEQRAQMTHQKSGE
jgi:hypothetical protein